jgi:hypothetical protein
MTEGAKLVQKVRLFLHLTTTKSNKYGNCVIYLSRAVALNYRRNDSGEGRTFCLKIAPSEPLKR